MSYPTIILGAGASNDFIHPTNTTLNNKVRPPLTKNLCNPRYYLIDNIITYFNSNFPKTFTDSLNNIITQINTHINDLNLENQLTSIKEKSKILEQESAKTERMRQLITFEFYLQKLFQEISNKFAPYTNNNYRLLIDHINDYSTETCFINLNYFELRN